MHIDRPEQTEGYFRRRRLRIVAAAAALAAVAVATGGVAASESPVGSELSGGTLRVVERTEPNALSPLFATPTEYRRTYQAIMEPFVFPNADNSAPSTDGLAVGWEQVDDVTWHFTVREGVTFQNGEPLNAEAVVFSIVTSRDTEGSGLAPFMGFADAFAVDEYTVAVVTDTPDATVPARLGMLLLFAPAYYEEVGADEFFRAPVGTGPFQFDSWTPGQQLVMTRFDGYWGQMASVDRIEITWAPEASTRIAMLEAGDADLITDLPPDATIGNGTVHNVVGGNLRLLRYSALLPPFDDIRLRQAVAHSIDRDTINDAIFGAAYLPWYGIYPPGWSAGGGHEYLQYDPDRARALVEEYEAENGALDSIELHWGTPGPARTDEVAEALAGMIEAGTGLTVVRSPQENANFTTEVRTHQMTGMMLLNFDVRYPHPDLYNRTSFTTTALTRYCNDDPALDERIFAAAAITDQAEADTEYNALENLWIVEKVCWSPLYEEAYTFATAEGVEFTPRVDALVDWNLIQIPS